MGLTAQQTLSIPFGLLSDLIAVHQIQHGADRKKTRAEEEAEFFDFITYT